MLRARMELGRINPLNILSGAFMLFSPFAAWMTLSAFGYVSGSNLWQITRLETSFPLGRDVPLAARSTSILLVVGGLFMFIRPKLGLPLATAAVLLFSLESYSDFGSFPGAIRVSILPGLGFFLGLCGIILGLGAVHNQAVPAPNLLLNLRTRMGLGQAGIGQTSVFLGADAWSHWSAGQLSGFLGVTVLEGAIHRVMFLGVAILLMLFLVQKDLLFRRTGAVLVIATFCGLLLDAAYHFTTGSIVEFVGHDSTEILLHGLTYYGMATMVAARFLLKH